jgi:tetratricopeptide (TPR) repeat protein
MRGARRVVILAAAVSQAALGHPVLTVTCMGVLDDIRHAAFELRQTDPQEAVRILRRAAKEGGEAEVLARGALGEIYLEEFGDLDGAEHEFRKVLQAAPGLTAAEIGLARTRREAGDAVRADAGFVRAIEGLSRDIESFRESKELPPGAEEVVLTLLEVAVELLELRSEGSRSELRRGPSATSGSSPASGSGAGGTPQDVSVPLDEELLSWAADEKLFEEDDWVRFHSLWTELRTKGGRAEEALAAVRLAERQGELPAAEAARLLSRALEALSENTRAGAEARRRLFLLDKPWPVGEVVRAAHLLGTNELLQEALAQHPQDSEEAAVLREALGAKPLVTLGKTSA